MKIIVFGLMMMSSVLLAYEDVKLFYNDGHSYLMFFEEHIVHDPDCGCADKWIAVPLDSGAFMIRRLRPSDYD